MSTADVDDYHEQLLENCQQVDQSIANLGSGIDGMSLEEVSPPPHPTPHTPHPTPSSFPKMEH